MTLPTLKLECSFTTNPYDTPDWYDISSDLISFSYSRGRQNQLDRFEAGTCTLLLKNLHGYYWENNPSSPAPYLGNIDLRKKVRLSATYCKIYEYYKTGSDDKADSWGTYYFTQTFTPLATHTITHVKLLLLRLGALGTVTVSIYATDGAGKPTGGALCSGTTDGDTLTTSTDGEWRDVTISAGVALSANTKYAIVPVSATGDLYWLMDTSAPSYSGGSYGVSANSGSTWSMQTDKDFMFEEWGEKNTYPRFTGYIESILHTWSSDKGIPGPAVQITLTDAITLLSRAELNNAGYASELSGTRVDHVLDDTGFPADRSVDPGKYYMQATGALVRVNPQDHLFNVAQAEMGLFYILADGSACFEDIAHRVALTPGPTFTDSMATIEPLRDDALLCNEARSTVIGGTEQVVNDSTLMDKYGLAVVSQTGLYLLNDGAAGEHSAYLFARYSLPSTRMRTIGLQPQSNPDVLFPAILGCDLGAEITLALTQGYISGDYFIEAIQESFDYRTQLWETTFMASDTSQYLALPPDIDEILRPDANGDVCNLIPSVGTNWQCVAGATPGTDYVSGPLADTEHDLYLLNPVASYKATINSVKVYAVLNYHRFQPPDTSCRLMVKTEGAEHFSGSYINPLGLINDTWALNPETGIAWTLAEIQALQAGIELSQGGYPGNYIYCYQLYVVVNLSPEW
jgi:hypothetical protein